MIEKARSEDRKIVLLARGGFPTREASALTDLSTGKTTFQNSDGVMKILYPSDTFTLITDSALAKHLASKSIFVLAVGAFGSEVTLVDRNLVMLPYLKFDYSAVLAVIDLVVHHGECK